MLKKSMFIIQDISIGCFLFTLLVLCMGIGFTMRFIEDSFLMMSVYGFILLLNVYRFRFLSFSLLLFQLVGFGLYQWMSVFLMQEGFVWGNLLWLLLLINLVCMDVFIQCQQRLEDENKRLMDRLKNQAQIHPIYLLANQEALNKDLKRMMGFNERTLYPSCLLVIQVKHYQEIKRIFSTDVYHQIMVTLIHHLQCLISVEDRLYGIDDEDTLAILTMSSYQKTTDLMMGIKKYISESNIFDNIIKQPLLIELRISLKTVHQEDTSLFIQQAVGSIQYDV